MRTDEQNLQDTLRRTGRLPGHVAIIMDGNGRWAEGWGRPRVEGHRAGMESVRDIVKACSELGIGHLTLYAFSIENWNRPSAEVSFLMHLLETFLRRELADLHKNNVRVRTIGKTNALPKAVQRVLRESMEQTKNNDGLTLTLALSYGARWDMARAMQMMALDVRRGTLSPEDVTESAVSRYLQTAGMPDPDLIIRTSGEYRLSNFLLWEGAYAEIHVTETLWPDFRRTHLYRALADYLLRERRFGKTSQQIRTPQEEADDRSTLHAILHAR